MTVGVVVVVAVVVVVTVVAVVVGVVVVVVVVVGVVSVVVVVVVVVPAVVVLPWQELPGHGGRTAAAVGVRITAAANPSPSNRNMDIVVASFSKAAALQVERRFLPLLSAAVGAAASPDRVPDLPR